MGWTSKYWDIIESHFWSPSKLGLRSIPEKHLQRSDEHVLVPHRLTNPNGPLYRRVGRESDAIEALRRSEEALNDIFDIAFAILADQLVCELLFEPVGISPDGPITSVGNIDTHFKKNMNNITQPDGFYVGPKSVLCVEMKLNDDTRLEQIAKYAMLMLEEERRAKTRKELALLFIVPANRKKHFESRYTGRPAELAVEIVERSKNLIIKKPIDKKVVSEPQAYLDVLRRIRYGVLSWSDLAARLERVARRSDDKSPEGQTVARLLDGLREQLLEHGDTGVPDVGASS
jgi:hypothetical protein